MSAAPPLTLTSDRRPEIERLIRSLPSMLSGVTPDEHGIAAGFRARVGFQIMSLIATNFDDLGKGGVGADGDKWAWQTPEYLAYGRGPKSTRSGTGRAPTWPNHPGSGYMDEKQRAIWWRIYKSALAWTAKRYDIRDAKSLAASIAWKRWTDEGGRTLIVEFGHKRVGTEQILRDYGTLFRSLQRGELTENGTTASYQPASEDQIFEVGQASLTVGTRAPGWQNHSLKGRRKDGQPRRRRFWPQKFPSWWWDEILRSAATGLLTIREALR